MKKLLVAVLGTLALCSPASADQLLGPGYRTTGGAVYFRGSPSNFVLGLPQACPTNQFTMGSSTTTGLPICVQPAFSNLSGSATAAQMPAFTGGDCTTSAGSVNMTCTPFGRLAGTNAWTGANSFTGGSITVPTQATGNSSTNAASTNFVQNQITASLSSNSVLGFRNRLINGDDRIDQRNAGASQTFTAGAALAYADDRWYAYSTGANVTGQQVAGGTNATPAQKRYQFTGAASTTGVTRCQRVEAANSYDMAGQNAVFSVDLADSLLTTVNYTIGYANTSDSFGTVASPTVTSISSGSFTVNTTLTRYSTAAIAIPAAATTGLQVCLSVGAQTSGTWTIGAAQLEMGSTATTFERRQYAFELMLSQRYYETGNGYQAGSITGSGAIGYYRPFVVTKRVTPTVTQNYYTFANISGITPEVSQDAVGIQAMGNSSGTYNYYFHMSFTASAEL